MEEMEPGKTYVTILPGRKRPAFVRKRRDPFDKPSGIAQSALVIRPRSQSVDQFRREIQVQPEPNTRYIMGPPPPLSILPPPPVPPSQAVPPSQWVLSSQPILPQQSGFQPLSIPQIQCGACSHHPHPSLCTQRPYPTTESIIPQIIDPSPQVSETAKDKVVTSNIKDEVVQKHTCSTCGKFRSPSYHARHPLAPGEVPRPSTCRRCIKEQTSTEESDTEEIQHQKKHYRKNNQKEGKRNKKNRASIRSSRISGRSSSSLEDLHISHSQSNFIGDSRHSRRHPRHEKLEVLERTSFVQTSPQRSPPRSRLHNVREDFPYEWRLERRNSEHGNKIYTRRESRIPPEWGSIDENYSRISNDENSRRLLQQSSSLTRIPKTTLHRAEKGEDVEDYGKQNYTYEANKHPPSSRDLEKSYDYDPNYDAAPVLVSPIPPTRRVRIVKVTMDNEDIVQPERRNENRPKRAPKVALARSASYHAPSRKSIIIESAESRRARTQSFYKDSIMVEEQDGSDDYSPPDCEPPCRHVAHLPPAAPWNPQERYSTEAPESGTPHEIIHTSERTYITPAERYTSRHHGVAKYSSNRCSRSVSYAYPEATYREAPQEALQYIEVPEGNVYYKEV